MTVSQNDQWVDIIQNLADDTVTWLSSIIIPLSFVVLVILFIRFIWNRILSSIEDDVDATSYNTLRTLGRFILFTIAIVLIMSLIPEIGTLAIGIGALLGTAIGFASTQAIGNFISGLYIILSRPFGVGDYVIIPKLAEGVVSEISVNYTKISTRGGTNVVIPNRTLLNATIVNTSLKRVRKIKEKKQKTKDEDNDFDFDMEFMTEKFSAMFAGKKLQKAYLYPLEFILGVSEYSYNKISERFSQVSEKFKEKTLEPISWFVLSRNRQDIKFQLSLIVDDALVLLDLIDEVNDELTKVFSPS